MELGYSKKNLHPLPPTDGMLEILVGGGVEGSGNLGRRGVFGLGDPGGRGLLVVPEIWVEEGSKTLASIGGVDFFWNNHYFLCVSFGIH